MVIRPCLLQYDKVSHNIFHDNIELKNNRYKFIMDIQLTIVITR